MTVTNRLFDTRSAATVFALAVLGIYGVMPLLVYRTTLDPYLLDLAGYALVACAGIYVGSKLPLFDRRFVRHAPRFAISAQRFHLFVWLAFGVFLLAHFATADAIPLFSVFYGADAYELSQQRGELLKTREGAEAILPYLSTLFVSALLPYSLTHLYIAKSRFRHVLMLIFLGYSISFLHKSMFINVLLPLLYVSVRIERRNSLRTMWIVLVSLVLLYTLTILAYGRQTELEAGVRDDFFTANYAPSNINELLLWRSIAVPMVAARDTLLVFDERFDNQPVMGATSAFLSATFSLPRVPMERLVYEHQWGWSDIGNANAVFFTEALVNFGLTGVVAFSLFIGRSLRWFRLSDDDAFKALWTIYCFALFSGGLIGMLLSNAYLLMFFIAFLVRLKWAPPRTVDPARRTVGAAALVGSQRVHGRISPTAQ